MTMLNPRCIKKDNKESVMGIAYCSNGYLLPCCWLDSKATLDDLTKLGLYDESLKLKNNNSLEDIIRSPQWINFIRIISEDPEKAPIKCHMKCSND